jgi:4-amino-4-deoxy-L-arabinose transferase-like glycosyltransferase
VALHPGLIWYGATKAHPLTFDALFFSLALWQSFRLAERPTLRRFAVFGLIVGIGTLSRGTIIISLGVTGLWLLALNIRRGWPATIGKLVIAGLCAAIVIAPWTIRNSTIHHRFVFLLTTDAEDFWRGNNPHATGGSYTANGSLVQDSLSPQEQAEMRRQPNEIAPSNWFWQKSGEFVRANPGAFVRLFFVKLFHFWWFAPQTGVEYSGSWWLLYLLYYVTALILAAIGLWRAVKVRGSTLHFAALILLFVAALSVLQSMYYVEGRHRWAIEPMLLALSGAGVATLFDAVRRRLKSGSMIQAR